MDNDLVKKYEEYKKAKESEISNKERYKLLANSIYTNPADVDDFLSLLKGKKARNQKKKQILFVSNATFNRFN